MPAGPMPGLATETEAAEAHDARFQAELRRRVRQELAGAGLAPRDLPAMYVKTAVMFLWLAVSYALLVFRAHTPWQVAVLTVSLGLAVAGIGFNVQHDGSHGGYSESRRVNHLMALSLDLLGGSSYVWKRKHNLLHHTWPNVAGLDDDIDLGWLGRLSASQPRRAFHRLQHLYLWPLYGFLTIKWQFVDDFKALLRGRLGGQPMPRPRGSELLTFLGGKLVFAAWAFGLPLLLHPPATVLAVYVASAAVAGLTLSVVFQLAHCVPEAAASTGREPWAMRQAHASVDFARESRLLGWYLGGLNFQLEHHLFPQVCHLHYPRLAPVVEAACREYGVPYYAHPTLGAALRAHFRHLRALGRGVSAAVEA
jgi:linoleoyl-CoA desaturase